MTHSTDSISYKDAGVDIDAGNALVERIKGVAKRTRRPEVMAGLGGFGALCELDRRDAFSSRCLPTARLTPAHVAQARMLLGIVALVLAECSPGPRSTMT